MLGRLGALLLRAVRTDLGVVTKRSWVPATERTVSRLEVALESPVAECARQPSRTRRTVPMSLTRRLIGLAAVGSLLISPALVTPSASAEPVESATAPKTHTVEVGIHPFDVAIAQNLNNSGSYAFVPTPSRLTAATTLRGHSQQSTPRPTRCPGA